MPAVQQVQAAARCAGPKAVLTILKNTVYIIIPETRGILVIVQILNISACFPIYFIDAPAIRRNPNCTIVVKEQIIYEQIARSSE